MVRTRRAAAAAANEKISKTSENVTRKPAARVTRQTKTRKNTAKRPLQNKEEPPTKKSRTTKAQQTDFVEKNKQNVARNSRKVTRTDSTAKPQVHTPRQPARKPRATPNVENQPPQLQKQANMLTPTQTEAPKSFKQLESQWTLAQFDNQGNKIIIHALKLITSQWRLNVWL